MRSLRSALPFILAGAASTFADPTVEAEADSTAPVPACTATSSTGSGAFFDLRPDTAVAVGASGASHRKPKEDYHARGHDYGKNFTMNICGAVVEPVADVVGIEESMWANISAYYQDGDETFSLGSTSLDLVSRGRKLVLQYVDGSPCGGKESSKRRRREEPNEEDDEHNPWIEDDEDHPIRPAYDPDDSVYHDDDDYRPAEKAVRRKSATISFHCDRDPSATSASISFIGTDPDECAYFFEARSVHACAHAEPHKPGSVGPGGIFSIILLIAVLVYILGGVFYNRTISHARGWRQLPNYSLWANIWDFASDLFLNVASLCGRFAPSRGGYRHLGSSSPSSRNRNADAENRLIDSLDEEWDD